MKKTLFSILACCLSLGMAQAAVEDITLTFEDVTLQNMTPNLKGGAEYLVEDLKSGGLTGSVENLGLKTNTDYVGSFMAPDVNIGSTPGSYWTYTCSFVAGEDFTLNSLSLDILTFNNGGATQNNSDAKHSDLEITLTRTPVNGKPSDIATYNVVPDYYGTGTGSAQTPTYSYETSTFGTGGVVSGARVSAAIVNEDPSLLSIDVGDKLTLKVTARHNDSYNDGHFVGLGAARFNVTVPEPTEPAIPEPATATLSLLAIAALAARRRRK